MGKCTNSNKKSKINYYNGNKKNKDNNKNNNNKNNTSKTVIITDEFLLGFIDICKRPQSILKSFLEDFLAGNYENAYTGDGYVYAEGNIPVLLTAHMDTVHKDIVKEIQVTEDFNTISSPQGIGGDDRCGIWMIMEIIKAGYRPWVLFCEDEEIDGVGSNKFVKTPLIKELENVKYLIELDRANANDAVFYNCGNEDFIKWICDNTGYKEAHGSFSDISHLSPECDRASVNLSCGYYNAHTLNEYVVISEMKNTIEVVKKLLDIDYSEMEPFDYQEAVYDYYSSFYGKRNYYGYGNSYYSGYGKRFYESSDSFDPDYEIGYYLYDIAYVEKGKLETESIYADSLAEAIGKLFMQHPSVCFNDIYETNES